jgi:FixJ family two-component response regulator
VTSALRPEVNRPTPAASGLSAPAFAEVRSLGTVFLVDDDPDTRAQLSFHLSRAGYAVRAFASASEFIAAVGAVDAGCLVLDLQLGEQTGLDLLTLLAERDEERPVVMISGEAEVPAVAEAFRGGAVDFLVKQVSPEALCARVAQCVALDEQRRANQAAVAEVRRRYAKLTPREREVMPRLVAGHAVKRIASELGISPKTADVHRGRILQKMDCDSVVELVHAVRNLPAD